MSNWLKIRPTIDEMVNQQFDTPEFNAWATRVKDVDEDRYKYFIGIHGGLLTIVNFVVSVW